MRLPRIIPALVALCVAVAPLCGAESDTALERAREQRRAGNLKAAGEVLQEAVRKRSGAEASLGPLYRELGDILLQQGQGQAAAGAFESALAHGSDTGVVRYQAGLAYRLAGDQPKAAEHLGRAIELGFRNTSALLHLAGASLASGRYSAGLRSARDLLASRPRSPDILLRLGRELFNYFFYADALKAFAAALALAPASYEARFFAALANYLLNRHEETIRLLEPLAAGARSAEASSLLASALARQDRMSEAETLLMEAIERDPASPHPYLNLAFALLEQDRIEEAERWLDAFRNLGPGTSPKVFYLVQRNACATVAERLDPTAPLKRTDPERGQAYYELALGLAARHHHGTAVEALRLARRYEGNTPRTLQALAVSCLHLDPHGIAAVRLLEGLLALQPDRPEALHLLGRAQLRQGRIDEALAAHRAAARAKPGDSVFLTELGRALAEAPGPQNWEAAIETLAEAAALDPGSALAYYELGKLLASRNRFPEALRALEAAIATEPAFPNAYYALGQVHSRTGSRDEARRYFALFEEKRAAAQARTPVGAGFASGP